MVYPLLTRAQIRRDLGENPNASPPRGIRRVHRHLQPLRTKVIARRSILQILSNPPDRKWLYKIINTARRTKRFARVARSRHARRFSGPQGVRTALRMNDIKEDVLVLSNWRKVFSASEDRDLCTGGRARE